jgi:hypothetical protein
MEFKPNGGSSTRYKTWLVAKAFTQTKDLLNFHEAFAPISKLATVKVFQAMVISKRWETHQLDVNNVFLHYHLDEETRICMKE